MKDILDKIKKVYEEKVLPKVKVIGEKIKPIADKIIGFVKEHSRYFALGGLFVVLVLILLFFTGEDYNKKRIAKINSIEVSGEKYVPEKNFKVDAYPEVNQLIKEYFDAYVVADFTKLDNIVMPLSDMEKSYITMMSQFYEEYQNITCYTKRGLSKDSYIVSACFDIKFINQDTTAPSMLLFYVQTNEDGKLYINNLYSDFNMKYSEQKIDKNVYAALRKYTTQDDYLELYNQIEEDYNQLIKQNNEIYQLTRRFIPGVRQNWEDTVYYVEPVETPEETENSEAPAPSETPSETPAPQPETTPQPETPAPVIEKVKVSSNMNVRVRSGSGTSFSKVGDAYNGDVFVKLGEETGSDGKTWIKIQYKESVVGYIRSDFVVAVTE